MGGGAQRGDAYDSAGVWTSLHESWLAPCPGQVRGRRPCFLSSTKPRAPGPTVFVSLSPAVKIHANIGEQWLSSSWLFPRLCSPTWGAGGMADLLFTVVNAAATSPCPVPADPGSKFKAKVALLSNLVTPPAHPPSEGKSPSHTPVC